METKYQFLIGLLFLLLFGLLIFKILPDIKEGNDLLNNLETNSSDYKEIKIIGIDSNLSNIYGIKFNIEMQNETNWTVRDYKIYAISSFFKIAEFPLEITLDNYTKIYDYYEDIPLEDDCINIGYDESCFIKWDIYEVVNEK